MKKTFKILLAVLVVFALIQLIPVDRTNPPVDKKINFVDVMNPPQNISEILQKSCYDCHSNETKYPSYAYVAPISWSVKHHINEGREHLNFSAWNSYNSYLKKSMLEKAILNVKDSKMPMPGYVAQHPEARLSEAERKVLTDYFDSVLKGKSY